MITTHRRVAGALAVLAAVVVVVSSISVGGGPGPDPCAGDIDDNGDVGVTDLLDLLAAWGPCQASPPVVVAVSGNSTGSYRRVWSNGYTEAILVFEPGFTIIGEVPGGVEALPAGVTTVALGGFNVVGGIGLERTLSDGTVQSTEFSYITGWSGKWVDSDPFGGSP